MCSQDDERPSATASLDNLKSPMPWALKLRLIARNNLIKLRTGSTCCGHHGEPGC